MALSNAERQRKYKEKLKVQAADNAAFAEHRHILQEITGRLERAVGLVEQRVTAHSNPAIWLSLPPHEEERLTQLRRLQPFNDDGGPELEPQDHRFLGMSAQEWMTMPAELLAVFGLVDVVAEWKRQAAQNAVRVSQRPEDNATEQYRSQGPTDGEALFQAEETAESLLADHADTLPSSAQPTDYASLFAAFQDWLEDFCPFEARTKDRAKWVAENKFDYDGTLWSITIERPRLSSGEAAPAVKFTGNDGRVVERIPYIQEENEVRSPEVHSE